jgi:DNA polymerase III subunit epsilon
MVYEALFAWPGRRCAGFETCRGWDRCPRVSDKAVARPTHNWVMSETVAVIDFETTGMSPGQGARATEIAAVLVQDGQVVGRFQSLMNSGAWVPPFIEQLTGISNRMLASAPASRAVMKEVMRFTRGLPLVAHNAAFDRIFWHAEALLADCEPDPAHHFVCTLLLSRRLYPQAPNHRLGTLAKLHALPSSGRAHRALADAQTTAHLLVQMQADAARQFAGVLNGSEVTHGLLRGLQQAQRHALHRCVLQHCTPVKVDGDPSPCPSPSPACGRGLG